MSGTYMAERPLLEGEICETIAFSLSVILKGCEILDVELQEKN
jgi:hypothetical protein